MRAKLEVPVPRPGLIERPRVVNRLAGARDRRLVSIVAPPGYGKTTVLGQWAARDERAFAWVSLDHRDNDPFLFLAYVAEALGESVEPAVLKALRSAAGVPWKSALPRLGSALASVRDPVVLVFDDVHKLEEHDCLDVLAALLAHVPTGSQIVLAGRTGAGVGLAKLRADGELLELGPAELALTNDEAHALLDAAGVDATETEAQALNERAEGWAAGLYLAALASPAGGSSLASFGGDDRFVTDYLRAEELAGVTTEKLEFLLRTSVLERMSGPLCDAMLERRDSTRLLEELEAENLFVIPLDRRRQWFRYHHLFREMLRAELERREPELGRTLSRRAADWCETNGQLEVAIDYLEAAGDMDEVARLVGSCGFPYLRSGRVTTVERWLAMFDDPALLERYPAIAVFGTWLHVLRGRPDAGERWALAVESSRFERDMPEREPVRGLGGHRPRAPLSKGRRRDANRRRARGLAARAGEPLAPCIDAPTGDRASAFRRAQAGRRDLRARGRRSRSGRCGLGRGSRGPVGAGAPCPRTRGSRCGGARAGPGRGIRR